MKQSINVNSEKVSIPAGNRKMGAIPSVSLPPVVTCPSGVPCAKLCYARKMCRIYSNVRESYNRNLDILKNDPGSYWIQVKAAVMINRYFRFHVSSDIPTYDYFNHMVQIARECSGTEILAFTKRYSFVNEWIDANGDLPENLHIIFSEWGDGWTVPNPHNLPTSAVIFKGTEPRDGWKVCGGNCAECACRGCGCWELKKGETIAFYQH